MRDQRIDALKGFAIILVVVGHALGVYEKHTAAYSLIYSFHMGAIFFAAGLVAHGKLSKRAKQILFPWASWLLILSFLVVVPAVAKWVSQLDRLPSRVAHPDRRQLLSAPEPPRQILFPYSEASLLLGYVCSRVPCCRGSGKD